MKFLGYILRNARRNPVRSLLTIASISVCLFLVMFLLGYLTVNDDASSSLRIYNRIVAMSSQGFAQPVPIARVREIGAKEGVVSVTPFVWFGGKYGEESVPFAQFAIDPETIFTIYSEYTIPPDQLKAFQEDRASCVIGSKLAEDRGWKVGDTLPLRADLYPFDLDLTIRGIYDGPSNSDRRICFFHWDYLEEGLKTTNNAARAGNAGVIVAKCASSDRMASICKEIDEDYKNSDTPTRTQTEEAFAQMFSEFLGSVRWLIFGVGMAVVVSLILVAGNAMAMALRERTTEVAVLRAIGFGKGLVTFLVLAEAILVAGLGGVVGAFGAKLFFDLVDVSRLPIGLPFFYVPWRAAMAGLVASLLVGLFSGVIPAVQAANTSVVNGLRKVV
jgi:putative ABC transport system permease protein